MINYIIKAINLLKLFNIYEHSLKLSKIISKVNNFYMKQTLE